MSRLDCVLSAAIKTVTRSFVSLFPKTTGAAASAQSVPLSSVKLAASKSPESVPAAYCTSINVTELITPISDESSNSEYRLLPSDEA